MPKGPLPIPYRLINTDCFEGLKTVAAGSVDLVLTDLPYGTTQCSWDSVIPLEKMWAAVLRVVKDDAAVVTTAAQPFTSALVMSNVKMFRHRWAWIRGKRKAGAYDANRKPLKTFEDVVVFGVKAPRYYPQMTEGVPYTASSGKSTVYGQVAERAFHKGVTTRFPTDVLDFDPDDPRRRDHPTQKPVALMEYLVRTYSLPGDLVVDFCMGSGTTGVACGNLGRRFVGIDSDKDHGYFDTATRRITEAYERRNA